MKNNAMKLLATVRQFEVSAEVFRTKFVKKQTQMIKVGKNVIDQYRKDGKESNVDMAFSQMQGVWHEVLQDFVLLDAMFKNTEKFKGVYKVGGQLELFDGSERIIPDVNRNEEEKLFDPSVRQIAHRSGKIQ